jgi:excisionase family DNA binding protein
MQHDQQKLAYTLKEFMALAGVGRSFVYDELAEGRLKAVKAGRKTLIREEDAKAWLGALPAMKSDSTRAYKRRQMAASHTHASKNSNTAKEAK